MICKKEFGLELQKQLLLENDYKKISKWAFKIYVNHGLEFENGLDYFILKLIAMEEGPEFTLSREDLLIMTNKLISE